MNYVLWIFYGTLGVMLWAYVYALGGPQARGVITLGAAFVMQAHAAARLQLVDRDRPAPATIATRLPDQPHKRGHRQYVPAVGVAPVPAPVGGTMTADPAMSPGDVMTVQHAVPLDFEPPAAEAAGWDDLPDRLLATLSARDGAIRVTGWGTGEWRAVA